MDYTELKKEVEQEEWFTLADGYFNIYSKDDVQIELEYKGEVCKIDIYTTGKNMDACHIYCSTPDCAYSRKKRRAKTLTSAVRAIGDVFYEATQAINRNVEQEKIRAERERLQKEQRQNIIEKLKFPIITNTRSWQSPFVLTFAMSKHFVLTCEYEGEPGHEKFAITGITGGFGLERIQKFMDCLNESTEAATDRILNGK